MTRKAQTQLLVSQHMKDRLAALAVVRQESRAEVTRVLIEAALPGFEETHYDDLIRLDTIAEAMNMRTGPVAEHMLNDRLTITDVENWDANELNSYRIHIQAREKVGKAA